MVSDCEASPAGRKYQNGRFRDSFAIPPQCHWIILCPAGKGRASHGFWAGFVCSRRGSMDGSPIFDIKPYLAYCDSHPEALEGFTGAVNKPTLHVEFPQELLERLPQGCREGLLEILAQDPRPGYQNEPNRVYGMTFAGFEIGFTVAGTILTVCRVEENGVQ